MPSDSHAGGLASYQCGCLAGALHATRTVTRATMPPSWILADAASHRSIFSDSGVAEALVIATVWPKGTATCVPS